MSDNWLWRRFLVFAASLGVIGGVIGWLSAGEVDPEV